MRRPQDRVALASFAGCSLLAGGNAVGVRFSNRELDPLWGAAVRFGAAAVVLLAIMVLRRLPLPRGRALAGTLLFGVLNFAVTFGLAYHALVRIHAGLGQTILALVPLVTLLLAVAQHQERFRTSAVVGTLFAVAGVALASRAPLQNSVPPGYLLALLGSVLCLAQAAVLVRRLPAVHPVTMNALGMTAAAVVLFAGSLVARDHWTLPERATTWWALGYLVIGGSVLTFVLYLVVIQRWSASRAAYVFVIIPLITIVLSAWLDDEPLTAGLLLGAPLILTGVYLGALRPIRHPVDGQ
ncbi:drug/metabolite transporter (DMT)-like permease [Streptomyces sp. SLBN-118]|uniref:DMT family transporter n=1 Tax=Streptomyces sp. SLBN-118 TaxID=2768454 RepID=UPI00114F7A99|nr:EamA family transporter [Streptomyces sp. SLBN-118]TQK50786.1 drug/metabolite transporter (DMT)-like permease [Streptomyces sp. SLBN-118]